MARAVVLVGTPVDLEMRSFTYKNGEKAGEDAQVLGFRLQHSATALAGTVSCETRDESVMSEISAAHEGRYAVQVVAVPRAVRYERDGAPADWVKMNVRGVVS